MSDTPTSSNAQVKRSLDNLIDHVKKDVSCAKDPPHLSHYRDLPEDVEKAYRLLENGAQMVHSTATKYTLVGKINEDDQKKLGTDLLRGCELIGACLHTLLQDGTGCSRAVRHLTQRASLSIFINVQHLVQSFEDHTALEGNVGARLTGAVWEACDHILKKMLPRGNRNAIRRELFTWTRECQDTMEEFQEMVDMGPREAIAPEDGEDDDDFGLDGEEEQYSDDDLPIAKACLGLLKNSRGNMKIALETCEALGEKARETQDEQYLDSIQKVHELSRSIGEGVTDLGSIMYPPLTDLEGQVKKQVGFIKNLQDYILSLEGLPSNISEFANVLRNAAETRESEFYAALEASRLQK
mmetsp:Transcript_6339/g.9900  ORF Transcript_6339/g.9900 Transcript_6339/m.9900 type:complete len:354 (-) Transcript_6339:999-2060(-)